jgi:serine protease Do
MAAREPRAAHESSTAASARPVERVTVSTSAVDDLEVAFKRAVARAGPAVVSIYTSKTVRMRSSPFPFELFDPHGQGQEFTQRGLGSGFIFDEAGHVLTNYHVIAGADEILLQLADDREFKAELLASDPPTDLALLQIDAEQLGELDPVELGDSDVLEVGDWVVAIGIPYGLSQTVSVGIVSAKGRANIGILDFEDFIQTDAAINPGNSGGPLVDLDGRVIAISTAIASRGGGSEGIAFAIPINMAKAIVDQLLDTGKVARGSLGVVISPLTDEPGVLVQDVIDGSAAARAGIHARDVIRELDGEPVTDVTQFRATIAGKRPGSKVTLGIWRDGQARELAATLDEAAIRQRQGDLNL